MNVQRSGPVILARLRAEYAPPGHPPEVHAYRVPDGEDVWRAPCGSRIKPDAAEVVQAFTGAPCTQCAMIAALSSDAPPLPRAELDAPSVRELDEMQPEEIVGASASGELYALSWREREVHRVAPDAARTRIDGRPLVIGQCGGLGWGPRTTVPGEWPMCAECEQIAGART
ncbi:hypothetical protein GCM10023222_28300 [Saccharopolyspora cebuensis]